MRGLDTRVMLANARIMLLVDAAKAVRLMGVVEQRAEMEGWTDAEQGVHTLPKMFEGENSLTTCWHDGQQRHRIGFDQHQWRDRCERMASDANRGCGLSYDLFVTRFSAAVDTALERIPSKSRDEALQIAVEHGYATAEERDENERINHDMGYCSHGIDRNCCPCGCGDIDDDWDDDSELPDIDNLIVGGA